MRYSSGGYKNNRRSSGGSNFRRFPSRRRFSKGSSIDESKFIKHVDTVTEKVAYVSEMRFDDLKISKELKANVLRKGYHEPTPIQDKTIPLILQGKDLVGIANTGTGKTLAFLLPILDKVLVNRRTKVLIIAPTRELAGQINDELFALTPGLRVFSALCTGGNSIFKQISAIKRGYNFIIGTPGRLKDLYERRVIDFEDFNTVILDEVDRMLDMGFVDDIKRIISHLPAERQSLFFSATMDNNIERIMNMLLKRNFEKISVKTQETAENVDQDVIRVNSKMEKLPKLEELLRKEEFSKVLVFVNTKRGVEKLCRELRDNGHRADSIHGDRKQSQRQRAIDDFKRNRTDVLIATDVAARGLDISNVSHVINFDIPESYQDYIHRIGRTGRANKKGVALTFVGA